MMRHTASGKQPFQTKVLVVGMGIAGTCAALSSAEALRPNEENAAALQSKKQTEAFTSKAMPSTTPTLEVRSVLATAPTLEVRSMPVAKPATEAYPIPAGKFSPEEHSVPAASSTPETNPTSAATVTPKTHVTPAASANRLEIEHSEVPSVMLVGKGPLFSGSSFFEGTWGLGLIAPDGSKDEDDLAQTIIRVGGGKANEALVRSFVSGILPSLKQLEAWGVSLMRATESAADQREYIPCFDHKHRAWRGIQRDPYIKAIGKRIKEAGIQVHAGWELLDIDPHARLATFFVNSQAENQTDAGGKTTQSPSTHPSTYQFGQRFVQVRYDALVLCTGGASSLYPRHLTKDDCSATVQGLVEHLGCPLVNMAFLQYMPGIVSPIQDIVFNEKTFRYMKLDHNTESSLGGVDEAKRLLALRSGYGPFTCRLESCKIDFAIQNAGKKGLALTPCFNRFDQLPEFVQTYQSWLHEKAGVSETTPLRIAMYAHASNGGIAIDQQGHTGIPGIFAAGECTGGMHGADRLGGLSSANGLVFGIRTGKAAATFSLQLASQLHGTSPHVGKAAAKSFAGEPPRNNADTRSSNPKITCTKTNGTTEEATLSDWTRFYSPQAARIEKELSLIMDESCSLIRQKHQVEYALDRIHKLASQLADTLEEATCEADAAATRTTQLRLMTAKAIIADILRQRKSCGSHYWKS